MISFMSLLHLLHLVFTLMILLMNSLQYYMSSNLPLLLKDHMSTVWKIPSIEQNQRNSASSLSNIHMVHYITLCDLDSILNLHLQLILLPFKYGFTLERWTRSLYLMLLKIPPQCKQTPYYPINRCWSQRRVKNIKLVLLLFCCLSGGGSNLSRAMVSTKSRLRLNVCMVELYTCSVALMKSTMEWFCCCNVVIHIYCRESWFLSYFVNNDLHSYFQTTPSEVYKLPGYTLYTVIIVTCLSFSRQGNPAPLANMICSLCMYASL